MTFEYRWVSNTTQWDVEKLPVKSFGNRFCESSFTKTWSSYKTEDFSLQTFFKFTNSDDFKDGFLHVLDSVMLLIQNLFCILQVEFLLRFDIVWDSGKFFQIRFDDSWFHGVFVHMFVLIFFVLKRFLDLLRGILFVELFCSLLQEH